LLSIDEMDQTADWIHTQREAGKHVYVHCLGGVGRSATAIAAYLMKYGRDENNQPLTLEVICSGIKGSRKKSTIWNKLQALRDYDNRLKLGGVQRPERSNEINALIQKLDGGAKKLKKQEIAALIPQASKTPDQTQKRRSVSSE
ncbi:MAG TPA: dual specificity protein phosphatase family protein, partial [Rhabdochlamydiaceae bacterium]